MSDSSKHGARPPNQVSPWEWVAAAVSAALVLGLIGVLVVEAVGGQATPADVRVQVERVVRVRSGYLVEFRVENRGEETAASLEVEGVLLEGDSPVESRSVTLDFVPAESHRSAALYFSRNPARYRLEIRPGGYQEP